jgi:hypothetical protein
VPIAGHVCGRGAVKHEDFAIASGEMDEDQFRDFLEQFMSELAKHSVPGSISHQSANFVSARTGFKSASR